MHLLSGFLDQDENLCVFIFLNELLPGTQNTICLGIPNQVSTCVIH